MKVFSPLRFVANRIHEYIYLFFFLDFDFRVFQIALGKTKANFPEGTKNKLIIIYFRELYLKQYVQG